MRARSTIVVREVVGILLLFPLWWYTAGLRHHALSVWRELKDCERFFHLGILLRHILTPLYGYTDWQTRTISVFVRLGHLLVYLIMTLVTTAFFLGEFLLWVVLPPAVALAIGYQLHLWSVDPWLVVVRILLPDTL